MAPFWDPGGDCNVDVEGYVETVVLMNCDDLKRRDFFVRILVQIVLDLLELVDGLVDCLETILEHRLLTLCQGLPLHELLHDADADADYSTAMRRPGGGRRRGLILALLGEGNAVAII
ncbi:pectin methylesterase 3 [Actinidia rufa]|uniref:Pectin methylesterase 3 n=1 Tax=Actinidia rufa TaxID=165716 RepID=A0A7J0FRR9_9ERIC|nr:pectin methylesterase 3 [Actinidia rufa]